MNNSRVRGTTRKIGHETVKGRKARSPTRRLEPANRSIDSLWIRRRIFNNPLRRRDQNSETFSQPRSTMIARRVHSKRIYN